MDISRDELEYIMRQFSWKNMSFDMCMFFITQDIDYDDVFLTDFMTDKEFYIDTFKHIWAWCKGKIDNGNVKQVCMDVILKLRCEDTTDEMCYDTGWVRRDWFAFALMRQILQYMVVRFDPENINTVIDHIMVNEGVDRRCLLPILLSDSQLCQDVILENIIRQEYLDTDEILTLIIERGKVLDDDTIRGLVLGVFYNQTMLLDLAYSCMKYYDIGYKVNDSDIDVNVTNLIQDEETKHIVEVIRGMISDIIYVEAEYDFYDFLEDCRLTYISSGDNHRSGLYTIYQRWMVSDTREQNQIPNLIELSYEDSTSETGFSMDNFDTIMSDVKMLEYICMLDAMDGFDLFKRMFNINRFQLCQYGRVGLVSDKATSAANDYLNMRMIQMAADMNLYLFLKLR